MWRGLRTASRRLGYGRDGGQDGSGAAADDCGRGDSGGEAGRCARRFCRATTTRTTTWRRLPDGSSTLTMKPRRDPRPGDADAGHVDRDDRERVDKLGVSEPVVQQYGLGENQILVELPGVSDPGAGGRGYSVDGEAVDSCGGGRAVRERSGGAGGAMNGVIPPDAMLVHGAATSAGAPDAGLAAEARERGGGNGLPRCAAFDRTRTAGRTCRFTLTTEAGDRFYKYTSAHSSTSASPGSMAIVLDNKVREVAAIKSAIRDRGEIDGRVYAAAGERPVADAADGRAAGVDLVSWRRGRLGRAWVRRRFIRAWLRRLRACWR